MEQSEQPMQPVFGVVPNATQIVYAQPTQPAFGVVSDAAQIDYAQQTQLTLYTQPTQPAFGVVSDADQIAYAQQTQLTLYTQPTQPAFGVLPDAAQIASAQPTQPAFGVLPDASQIACDTAMNQPTAQIDGVPQATTPISDTAQQTSLLPTNPAYLASHQIVDQQFQELYYRRHQPRVFWANRMLEIRTTTDFKNHCIPLRRIKRIMSTEVDVRMITVEALVVFAKACENFILELTFRSWIYVEEAMRTTLRRKDIVLALTRNSTYDFLVNLVCQDEEGVPSAALAGVGVPTYQMAGAGRMMDHPAHQTALYARPLLHSSAQMTGAEMMIENPTDEVSLLSQPQAQQQAATQHQQDLDVELHL